MTDKTEGWGVNLDANRILVIIKREYLRLALDKSALSLSFSIDGHETHSFYLEGELFAGKVTCDNVKFNDLFKLSLDDYSDKHIYPAVMANEDIHLSHDYVKPSYMVN